jgi:hypothetical protein
MRSPAVLLARSAAIAVAVSISSPSAIAQTLQDEPTPATTAFKLGQMFAQERRYDVACPKFEESYRLDPRVDTLFYLADCWEHTGRLGNARARFVEVAETAGRAGHGDLEATARARAAAIEAKLPLLVVEVKGKDPGLEVSIDGMPLRSAEWGTPVPLDPGKHVVEARAPSRRTRKLTFELPREPQTLRVTVPPLGDESGALTAAAPDRIEPAPKTVPADASGIDSTLLAAGVVAGALGVAGIAVGTVSGLNFNSKNRDADAACPTGRGCTPADVAAYDAAIHDAKNARGLSLTAFAIGGSALLGSVILLVSAPRGSSRTVGVAPAFDRSAVGATLSGRW